MRLRFMLVPVLLLAFLSARVRAEGTNQLGVGHRVHESTVIEVDVVNPGEVILISLGNDSDTATDGIIVQVKGPDGADVSGSPFTILPGGPGFLRPVADQLPEYKTASALQVPTSASGVYTLTFDNTGGDYLHPLEITVVPNGTALANPSLPPDGGRVSSARWRLSTKGVQYLDLYALVPLDDTSDAVYRVELNGVVALDWTAVANSLGFDVSPQTSAPGILPPCFPGLELVDSVCLPALADEFRLYLNRPRIASAGSVTPQLTNVEVQGPTVNCPGILPNAPNYLHFDSNVYGTAYVLIDRNKDGSFEISPDELLVLGEVVVGPNVLEIPGNGPDGSPVPPGDYKLQIVLRAGELHVPLRDVDVLDPGLRIFRLEPGSPSGVETTMYWNDTFINNGPLVTFPADTSQTGISTGDPSASEPICSIDSGSGLSDANAHCWPKGGVGDKNAIDTWVVAAEVKQTLDVRAFDPTADDDQDGLSNGLECGSLGTDPTEPDTDGGGVTDGDEVNLYLTDPLDGSDDSTNTCDNGRLDGDESDLDCGGSCSACIDGKICHVDGDCQSGYCESGICTTPVTTITYCSDATNPDDCDGDGIPNTIEDANGNGVHDPGETDFANVDSDGDGLPDGLEDPNHNGVVDPGESDPVSFDPLKVRGGGGCQQTPSPTLPWEGFCSRCSSRRYFFAGSVGLARIQAFAFDVP